jgi:hypothetical protein
VKTLVFPEGNKKDWNELEPFLREGVYHPLPRHTARALLRVTTACQRVRSLMPSSSSSSSSPVHRTGRTLRGLLRRCLPSGVPRRSRGVPPGPSPCLKHQRDNPTKDREHGTHVITFIFCTAFIHVQRDTLVPPYIITLRSSGRPGRGEAPSRAWRGAAGRPAVRPP